MSKSPVIVELVPILRPSVKTSVIPTMIKPIITRPIPLHSLEPSFLSRNPIDKIPVKTITAPLNI